MAATKQTTVRFSPQTLRALKALEKKLDLDRSNVIRLAIARLAEAEKVGADSNRLR